MLRYTQYSILLLLPFLLLPSSLPPSPLSPLSSTFEPVQSLVMGDSVGNVYKMTSGHHGVWVTFRSTSVVSLFDSKHYVKLMQLDYTTLMETHSLHTEMVHHSISQFITVYHSIP